VLQSSSSTMAYLTWTVLCTAIALIAASGDYGYGNYVEQPISNDEPSDSRCAGKENGAYGIGCSKDYWLCWEGASTSQECSFDLMFNQDNGQCDFQSNILACGGQPTTVAPADSPTMEPVDFDCSRLDDGDYPFSHNCQVDYVSCVAGAAWKRTCPDDLKFDPELKICNRIENIVACGGAPPTEAEPIEIQYECPSPSGTFPLVSSLCSATYYICENNVASIAVCSDEMIWDDSTKQCRLPSEIPDCSFDCAGKADSAYSIGCSQYYWWCWQEKATKLACPEGMVFNSENNQCDFNDNVFECTGTRVVPTTIANDFATPPPVDFDCTSVEDGNHPFTKDQCLPKFVSCIGGVAWEMTCPDGLLFDPEMLLCERVEHIVACGGSPMELETTTQYDNSYGSYSYDKPAVQPLPKVIKPARRINIKPVNRDLYSYDTTPAAEPITTTRRSSYGYKKTTPMEEPTTTEAYGDYETTTLNEPITTTRKSYGYKKTTPAAEPTTTASYDSYETTTMQEPITTTRRSSYGYKKATPFREPVVRRLEKPVRDSYYQKKTTPAAEPTTRRSYYQTTTPAAEPTTTEAYGSYKKTTPAAEPTTTASYDSYETTTMQEPITTTRRSSYGYKKTTPFREPTTKSYSKPVVRRFEMPARDSYYQKPIVREPTTRASFYQKKTTPAAEPTTRRSYYQTTTPAAEPTTTKSYGYETTTMNEPITTTRRSSYGYKKLPAREPTTRRSYYQTTTPAAEPTTRRAYSQPSPVRRLLQRKPAHYYTTTPAAEPATRPSYSQKRLTTLVRDIPTRRSYGYGTTPAAEPTTRRSYYQTTTPAAEPVTRPSYQPTTPFAEPTTRRTYKLTAAEPVTPKPKVPEIKQASYY
jgi:hypothetical protein